MDDSGVDAVIACPVFELVAAGGDKRFGTTGCQQWLKERYGDDARIMWHASYEVPADAGPLEEIERRATTTQSRQSAARTRGEAAYTMMEAIQKTHTGWQLLPGQGLVDEGDPVTRNEKKRIARKQKRRRHVNTYIQVMDLYPSLDSREKQRFLVYIHVGPEGSLDEFLARGDTRQVFVSAVNIPKSGPLTQRTRMTRCAARGNSCTTA